MTRKVFIDCGAWKGISSQFFKDHHPESNEFEFFAFECNPTLAEQVKKEKPWINLVERAAWINNEEILMYLGIGKFSDKSSSLLKTKDQIDTENPLLVKAIDFSQWIKDNFNITDHIIVKMNIEGAEYKIIDKMIKDDTFKYVNAFYIQWHRNTVNMTKEENTDFINNLKKRNKNIYGWHYYHNYPKSVKRFTKNFISTLKPPSAD